MATKQIHNYTAAVSIDGAADFLLIDPGSTGTYNKISRNILLGITSTPIGASDSQTLQNKTLDNTNAITVKDGSFTLNNTSDTTKKAIFSLAGITTGTTRTLTLPNRTDTLVTLAGTETLTNKTITSPTITGGTIDNASITVDSISGHTTAGIVSVGGVQMSSGIVNTAGAVTAVSIAAGGVQPQALVAGTGTGWAWQSWVPTFTNMTIGNGTLLAHYAQIGKVVVFRIEFTFGSSSAMGSSPNFTLPITAATYIANRTSIGQLRINNPGVGDYPGEVEIQSSTTALLAAYNAASTYATLVSITASIPAGWGSGFTFGVAGTYEAA